MTKIDKNIFFEHSIELLCVANLEGYFVELNPKWTEVLGFSKEELMSRPFVEFVHLDDRDSTLKEAERLFNEKGEVINFENRYLTKTGAVRWLSWNAIEKEGAIYAAATDVTYLKDQEKYFKELQEAAEIGYWRIDLQTNNPVWSEKTYDIHGLPRGSEIDMSKALDFYPGTSKKIITDAVGNGLEKGESWDLELPFLTADQRKIWVRAIGKPVVSDGKVVELFGTFQNITERKDSEMRFKYLIETVGDGFWDWYLQEDFEYMSPRFWQILGVDYKKMKHHPSEWQKFVVEEDLQRFRKELNDHIENRSKTQFSQELRFKHSDGGIIWIVSQGRVVEWDESGQASRMIGSHTDITQLKKAQIQLLESSKLASLGAMAGGIAHEINNPLTIISSNLTVLEILLEKSDIEKKEMVMKAVGAIDATVKRISRIIGGMKQLLHQDTKTVMHVEDLSKVVDRSLSLCLERIKSECIEPRVNNEASAKVLCDETQLSQVIVILVNNAVDAISGSDDPWIEVRTELVGDEVFLHILDSGRGIPSEHVEKIFDPFYTSKDVGKGTGLGLSIAKEILKKHSGDLYYNSEMKNTCFSMRLPKSKK